MGLNESVVDRKQGHFGQKAGRSEKTAKHHKNVSPEIGRGTADAVISATMMSHRHGGSSASTNGVFPQGGRPSALLGRLRETAGPNDGVDRTAAEREFRL